MSFSQEPNQKILSYPFQAQLPQHTHPLMCPRSLFASLHVSPSLTASVSLHLHFPSTLFISSVSLSVSLPPTPLVLLSLSSLCHSVALSSSMSLCLCISLSVSLPLGQCIFPCLSQSLSLCLSLSPVSLPVSFPPTPSLRLQASIPEQMAIRPWPEAHVITEAPSSVAAFQGPPGECKLSCHKQVAVTTVIQGLPSPGPGLPRVTLLEAKLPALLAQSPLQGPEASLRGTGRGQWGKG